MGKTHYWTRPTELPAEGFAKAVADVQRVLQASSVPVAGFEGVGHPILTRDSIVLNGQAPAACEPFEIRAVEFDRRGRDRFTSYCKTQGMPYDLVVKAALIVLREHLGDHIAVTSDENDESWSEARSLVQSILGFGGDFRLAPRT
jgi:hypothetical protein